VRGALGEADDADKIIDQAVATGKKVNVARWTPRTDRGPDGGQRGAGGGCAVRGTLLT